MVNVKISGLFRCCIQQYRVIKKAKSITKDKVDRCGSPINGNLKYELRDSKYEVIVRHTAVMTAATHARLCNTAPHAPDSELRTSYIVIRTFKL